MCLYLIITNANDYFLTTLEHIINQPISSSSLHGFLSIYLSSHKLISRNLELFKIPLSQHFLPKPGLMLDVFRSWRKILLQLRPTESLPIGEWNSLENYPVSVQKEVEFIGVTGNCRSSDSKKENQLRNRETCDGVPDNKKCRDQKKLVACVQSNLIGKHQVSFDFYHPFPFSSDVDFGSSFCYWI